MKVAVVMGSSSDLPTLEPAFETLRSFGVEFEARVVSAHRTPEQMIEFGKHAAAEGFGVIIAVLLFSWANIISPTYFPIEGICVRFTAAKLTIKTMTAVLVLTN